MEERGYLLHWHGPFFSIDDARSWLKENGFIKGIYIMFGYEPGERAGRPSLRYIGISGKLLSRLSAQHSMLKKSDMSSIWIAAPYDPDSDDKDYRRQLRICEWLLVHSMAPISNDRLHSKPNKSCAVINKFWKVEAESAGVWTDEYAQYRPQFIPNLIHYDWYTGKVWYIDFDRGSVKHSVSD